MAESVGLQIKAPDAFSKLSDIVGIARGVTELQKARATQGYDIEQRKQESEQSQIETLRKRLGLSRERMDIIEGNSNAMMSDPAVKAAADPNTPDEQLPVLQKRLHSIVDQHLGFVKANGVPAEIADKGAGLYHEAIDKDPRSFQNFLAQRQQAKLAPAGQVEQNQVPAGQQQTVQENPQTHLPMVVAKTPTGVASIAPVPAAGGMQPSEKPTTDALGNPAIQVTTPEGKIAYKAPPGSNTPPLMTLPPGETKETAAPLMALRQQTNQAAAEVPNQHFNNQQMIKLAPTAFTGTGGETFAKLLGAVGIQATNDHAADTAQLNHYLAKQTESNAAAMGANTDAARNIAERTAGSAKSPEQAIIRIVKVNDAYATGLELFNKGMEAAIKNPANQKSIFAARDFQNAWAQTFNPTAMMLHNAVQAKQKAANAREQMDAQRDIEEIVKSVGGKGSKGAEALANQYHAIEKLSTEGVP